MDSLINLVTWATTIVTVASLVAASTPTPKDDVWIGKLYKFIDFVEADGMDLQKINEMVSNYLQLDFVFLDFGAE